ncbi:hypothetical protein J31TS4_13960 [Paenibacillus sp. J31TS4]|uniref:hypothetical protein n=1 Tax=Paenibacillus sp. J31TS4 TaxID=2807195 RepID=UPI001B21E5E6|nr:hypothetical protein [Paenibacillus sp. J31TS4]GIP38116.1 hypothetical protein J31TS4_13960 [Paenibacillus sp. J31TS4]
MAKQTYYVSIAPNEIVPDPLPSNTTQFEILADDGDLARLQDLFEKTTDTENRLVERASTPYEEFEQEEEQDEKNELYDERLQNVYRLIYELGTEKTRAHIRKMDVLSGELHEDS